MDADVSFTNSEAVDFRNWCWQALSRFIARYPGEASRLQDLQLLLESGADLRNRQTSPGHLTASALILSPDGNSILLVHNRGLGRWLQPGGHMEAGEFPLQTARREVAEEVGLEQLELLPAFDDDPSLPLDIDSHLIPARAAKSEPAHIHHDFMYAMVVSADHPALLTPQQCEISAAEWIPVKGAKADALPQSLRRAFNRLKSK